MLENDYQQLALAYLQGQLDSKEQAEVLRLLARDLRFCQILRQEMELHKQLNQLHRRAPSPLKQRVYMRITTDNLSQAVSGKLVDIIMQNTLPSVIWQILQQSQRKVYYSG